VQYRFNNPKLFVISAVLFLTLISLIVGYLFENIPFLIKADSSLYILINNLPHITFLDKISYILGVWFLPWRAFFMPAFFYFLIIPFVVFMFTKRRSKFIKAMLTVGVAYFIALFIMLIDTHFVYRERPFLHLPAKSISSPAKYILTKVTSYPSGHARDTVILVLIMSYFIPALRIPLLCFAIILGFDRVYSGEHYPADVIAGMVYGFVIAKLSIFIIND
jgi:membrane-associated phospholipid phosphatase